MPKFTVRTGVDVDAEIIVTAKSFDDATVIADTEAERLVGVTNRPDIGFRAVAMGAQWYEVYDEDGNLVGEY